MTMRTRNNGLAAAAAGCFCYIRFVALAVTTTISLSPFFTTRTTTTTVVGAFIPYSPQQQQRSVVVSSRPPRGLLGGFHLQSECDCKQQHHHRRCRDGRARTSYTAPLAAASKATRRSSNRIDTSTEEEKDPITENNDNNNDSRLIQEPCNVVFTHTNADFDSLAAAVALSLLWQHEQPALPTHVVLPRGFHPVVQRFLAFHKHLLPLRGFKTIMVEDVRALGVVDAQSASRIGRGQNWLGKARSIHVFDHHESSDDSSPTDGASSNNKKSKENSSSPSLVEMATELVIDHVGSTTTLLVERLQKANIQPAPHEATLFVLGIRADTGGLVYESTTLRDARALLWCLENGASQVAISEFGVARVTEGQRTVLNRALRDTRTKTVHGMRVSSVLVSLEDKYVAGLAQVCEELLELTNSDVFLLGATHKSGGGGGSNNNGGGSNRKSKKGGNDGAGAAAAQRSQWVSLIGRASPRAVGVDLNVLMRSLGGGGHTKAAAAALRCVPPPPPATTTATAAATLPPEEEKQEGDGSSSASSEEDETTTSLEERLTLATTGKLTASSVLTTSIDSITSMIPEQLLASSFMVPAERIITVTTDNTVSDARKCFHTNTLKSAPVIDAQTGRFRGSLKLNDLVKAVRAGRSRDKLRGMMRSSVETVLPDTPLVELEELLVDKGVGRLPVVDDEGVLVGIVTRTDVLRQHKLYDESDLDSISGH